jgi:hypothetical protein
MKTQRTTFLAGVAALALIAGTSIATAQQDTSQEHKGAMQPRGSTPMKSNQGAGAVRQSTQTGKTGETERTGGASGGTPGQNVQEGKMGQTEGTAKSETQKGKAADRMNQSASEKGAGADAKEPNPHAQQMDRAHKTNTDQFGEEKTKKGTMDEDRAAQDGRAGVGASTSEQGRQGSPNTAQSRDERLKGLQGNATGVVLNDEQRTRIRDTIVNARGAPRVGSVDFDVAVGTSIPRGRIQIIPVPETLVQIEPEWRGFLYFIVQNELVIVNPRDMRIVAVVPV